MNELAIALFLAALNKGLVDWLSAPIRVRYPDLDLWWLIYVALATGAALGWVSGANLVEAYVPDPMVGRVLTSLLIGGGSSLIHDLVKPQPEA
jgi:hypothetical protein